MSSEVKYQIKVHNLYVVIQENEDLTLSAMQYNYSERSPFIRRTILFLEKHFVPYSIIQVIGDRKFEVNKGHFNLT